MPDRFRRLLVAAVVAVLTAACAPTEGAPAANDVATTGDATTGDDELAVVVASFDLAVGEDKRLPAGVFWDNVLDEAELVAHLDQLPEG